MQQVRWRVTLAEMEAEGLKKTPLRSFVIILTKRGILQEIVQSLRSQKTSIGLGDLRVDDW